MKLVWLEQTQDSLCLCWQDMDHDDAPQLEAYRDISRSKAWRYPVPENEALYGPCKALWDAQVWWLTHVDSALELHEKAIAEPWNLVMTHLNAVPSSLHDSGLEAFQKEVMTRIRKRQALADLLASRDCDPDPETAHR